MRFVLFVEGHTEHAAVPTFLKRWLDSRLDQPVGIDCVRYEGSARLLKDAKNRALRLLESPGEAADIIAVVALFDLYGVPLTFPASATTVAARVKYAMKYMCDSVGHPRFQAFLAVHEVEAWVLCYPQAFPRPVQESVSKFTEPEKVNMTSPPGAKLSELYRARMNRGYRKAVDGKNLFKNVDPNVAYARCPYLRNMLDVMLRMAKDAGL